MSIQDSIKTFKLFEVLRGGDTAAISKALQDLRPSESAGTTVLHLATQCAEPQVVDFVLQNGDDVDVNARDREGNTALHLAAQLGRTTVVRMLLDQPGVNDQIANRRNLQAIDLARTPEIFQQLHLARSLFLDKTATEIHNLVADRDMKRLEELLVEPRVEGALDVNALELATDPVTLHSGGTLLHEAARKKDTQLIQVLLMHGADPFRRDKKGKLPQDVTKDDRTKGILKKSPAAVVAQRGIQEKAILGSNVSASSAGRPGDGQPAPKDGREIKGYLKKWTNYTSGYKLRWFVLEDGVLSYYKHQDDAGSACRGAINMKIARLSMDPQDKTRFEIHGKSSVKYHLKANHVVEAKRWFWALNNAIQWSKDEAKEDERRRIRDADLLRHAKSDQLLPDGSDGTSQLSKTPSKTISPSASSKLDPNSASRLSFQATVLGPDSVVGDETASNYGTSYDASIGANDLQNIPTAAGPATLDGEDDEMADDASSHEVQPANKDAFNITAQSAKLQLDLLAHVCTAFGGEMNKNPDLRISDASINSTLSTFTSAVSNLNALLSDLLKISRDRDAYWQYRLDREADARKMWEDSMARVVKEHEDLQRTIDESEEKRKKTKKALKEALEGQSAPSSRQGSRGPQPRVTIEGPADTFDLRPEARESIRQSTREAGNRRKSVITKYTDLSDSESEETEEFFDAIEAGQIEVVTPPSSPHPPEAASIASITDDKDHIRTEKSKELVPSYRGYEDGVRTKLKLDADNRPKISLWGILKSMIGKDMTKMTLPVSFNEPTSLLQRVAEDMEYTDLLDMAADRTDSLERMVYVAAFAASEYASTIGRVAKPFNPLLGETYEYVRPDKGYRFFVEQVSHHPPIGAAYAESPKWDYWGESAVKSKFYGKSFDINPLGTWFLCLRPSGHQPEMYTWKKVTSSVVGIISGNPTVDNYGPMEIKNWTTGEVCILDFKARGWKASSAYQVTGRVVDRAGITKWSIGGRWNDKIYARHTPGFEAPVEVGKDQAILIWSANPRPPNIPFNLTPFVVTLNAVSDALRPHLPPTDTRLRPDQRAMEDGEYELAATEKNRVEEKQRAKRREREANGEEFIPQWFKKAKCPTTGEYFWQKIEGEGEYWKRRANNDWHGCEDIF